MLLAWARGFHIVFAAPLTDFRSAVGVLIMAAKKPNPAFEFTLEYLKKDRKAAFADVRDAAAKKRMVLYPIMYGRAQAILGIVKQAPRGHGKAKMAKEAKEARAAGTPVAAAPVAASPAKRGPGRPRKSPVVAFDGGLDGIVAAVRASEQAKARYRAALERIQTILGDALS